MKEEIRPSPAISPPNLDEVFEWADPVISEEIDYIGRTSSFFAKKHDKEKAAALREFFEKCDNFSDETIITIVEALRE